MTQAARQFRQHASQQGQRSDAIGRLASLDGLRGVAIALVVAYHAYYRWSSLLPWAAADKDLFLIKNGTMGVDLFFLLSGFVIYLTLERCATFTEFAYRRWLRLFPAMLISSAVLYATGSWLSERPLGVPQLVDVLPGLLFIEPTWLEMWMGIPVQVLDGAFWSLFVEVKFYLIFGGFYFVCRKAALLLLVLLFLAAWIVTPFGPFALSQQQSEEASFLLHRVFSAQHFGWFAIGALVYRSYAHGEHRCLLWCLALLYPAIVSNEGIASDVLLFGACLFLVFLGSLYVRLIGRLCASSGLVFFGFTSYPLYLIHQNAEVALTVKTHNAFPEMPGWVTPLPGLGLCLVISYVMARYGEPWVRAKIKGSSLAHEKQ